MGEAALHGPRGGATFHADDEVRLNDQASDIWRAMAQGDWWTLRALADWTGHPEASISARLRDFRKERFGGHTVDAQVIRRGLWRYRLVPNADVKVAA